MGEKGRCGQSAASESHAAALQKQLEPRVLDLCTGRILSALQLLQPAHPPQPLAGEHWWHHPDAPHGLEPGSPGDTHPYPVELDLPSWTVAADIDLGNWLFGFGAGIRIDSPQALREEHRQTLRSALEARQPD